MNPADDDVTRVTVARTLSLLPALTGLGAVVILVFGSVVAGVTEPAPGRTAVLVAALLIGATVISGRIYGLYVGLLVVTVAGLVVADDRGMGALAVVLATVVVVNDVVRFSLDARRPARFGPGLVGRYLLRTGAVAGLAAVLVVGSSLVVDRGAAPVWVGLGLLAAASPLPAALGADWLDRIGFPSDVRLRAVFGALATMAVVLVVAMGAQVRAGLVTEGPAETAVVTTTTTTVPIEDVERAEDPTRTLPRWVVLVVVALIGLFIRLMLRRPEIMYELEEVDRRVEDNTYDLAVAGVADQDDDAVELDDDAFRGLLRDLQVDLATEPDPGRAVRFGYARTEARLAERGLARESNETEREFLSRALPGVGEAGDALTELTGLFERARFSRQPVDEAMRARAVRAVEELSSVALVARPGGGAQGLGADSTTGRLPAPDEGAGP